MPEAAITLAPPRQRRVAGVTVGILRIGPEEDAPAAVLGVYNPNTGEPEQFTVRAGDEVEVAGRGVRVLEVVPGEQGHVDLLVSWPEDMG